MITPQLILGLHDEIFIDNFAGGGGASTGIERALRRAVDHALNHDRKALAMHRMNHPTTEHHPEDIRQADPLKIAGNRPVGGIWFSPDCKHFSKAKGGKPRSKFIRGLAWSVIHWVNVLKKRPAGGPRVIYLENVEEFLGWCPLDRDGNPSKWRKSWFFLCFSGALYRRGFHEIQWAPGDGFVYRRTWAGIERVLDATFSSRASDVGAPTIRKRLYLIARSDGQPVVWPNPSHGSPKLDEVKAKKRKPHRMIAECLDFSLPCPSIFLSKESARKVRAIRPLADSTMARIAKGVDRYVLKAKKPFIVELTHQGNAGFASIDDPIKTVTAANRGEKALVVPTVVGCGGRAAQSRPRGADEPAATTTAKADACVAQATLAPFVAINTTGHSGTSVTSPTPTIATGGHQILVESTLAPFVTEHSNASHQRNFAADEPMRTQCAGVKGGHFAAVSPVLVHTAHGEADKAGNPRRGRGARPVTEPASTGTASNDIAVVAPYLVPRYGERDGQEPRTMPVNAPGPAVVPTGNGGSLAAVHLTKFNTGSVGSAADEPAPTVTANSFIKRAGGCAPIGVVAAQVVHVQRQFGESVGSDAGEPVGTVTAGGGGKAAVCAASIVKLRGDAESHAPGHPVDEPAHTISAQGTHHGLVEATLAKHPTPEQSAAAAAYYNTREGRKILSDFVEQGFREQEIMAAYIAQHNGGFNTNPGHEVDAPVSTISSKGSQQQLVGAALIPYYGSEKDAVGVNEPSRTVTTRDRFGLVQTAGVIDSLSPEHLVGARLVAAFLRAHGVEFEGEFATVGEYVIVDIGMRMLKPRELYRAQGFPENYIIDRGLDEDILTGRLFEIPLTVTEQVRMCGNSVCPPMAEALVGANNPEMRVQEKAA